MWPHRISPKNDGVRDKATVSPVVGRAYAEPSTQSGAVLPIARNRLRKTWPSIDGRSNRWLSHMRLVR
ncbi:hypothetical protein ACRALDRAFT_2032240 [Sodiomyces alcalophilus JCM 7366]|uniref:uncharacterized protein n=1 Tax=Sodiomyces alcalophilus JCM 7366 TaxID=591952 RepID=UPI0039B6BDEF